MSECYCGGLEEGHDIEAPGCLRVWASETPKPDSKAPGNWIVGTASITDCTLCYQRGYYQHSSGRWSKSTGGSVNSLPDET